MVDALHWDACPGPGGPMGNIMARLADIREEARGRFRLSLGSRVGPDVCPLTNYCFTNPNPDSLPNG